VLDEDEDEPFAKNNGVDDDISELSSIEKVLRFIERMANSDGVHKRLKKTGDLSNTIKCNLMEKKDLLEPFRVKYAWYFRSRYQMETPKKKSFDDIMDMSSVWTNASQLMD
jgi:hypothetical protein